MSEKATVRLGMWSANEYAWLRCVCGQLPSVILDDCNCFAGVDFARLETNSRTSVHPVCGSANACSGVPIVQKHCWSAPAVRAEDLFRVKYCWTLVWAHESRGTKLRMRSEATHMQRVTLYRRQIPALRHRDEVALLAIGERGTFWIPVICQRSVCVALVDNAILNSIKILYNSFWKEALPFLMDHSALLFF